MPSPIEDPDFILRDLLAIDRTVLANERTLLSYVRTALALLAAGGSLIHFVEAAWAWPAGTVLAITGLLTLGTGVWRYRSVARHLHQIRNG